MVALCLGDNGDLQVCSPGCPSNWEVGLRGAFGWSPGGKCPWSHHLSRQAPSRGIGGLCWSLQGCVDPWGAAPAEPGAAYVSLLGAEDRKGTALSQSPRCPSLPLQSSAVALLTKQGDTCHTPPCPPGIARCPVERKWRKEGRGREEGEEEAGRVGCCPG